MEYSRYEKIIKTNKKIDWYGSEVPEGLITPLVNFASEGLSHEINKLEAELNDYSGVSKEKKKGYINALIHNLQNLPYTLNGDTYLIKKKKIVSEISEEQPKKPTRVKRNTNKTQDTTSSTTTKNGSLIFGKK